MLTWCAIVLFVGLVNCLDQSQLSSRSTVFFEQTYREPKGESGIIVKKSPLVYFYLEGYGEISVSMKSSTTNNEEKTVCRVFNKVFCLLRNTDLANFNESETFEVSFTVTLFKGITSSLSVRLVGSDVVELLSTPRYGFLFKGTKSVDLLVSFKDMPTNLNSKGKVQFFTLLGYRGTILASESLDIYMKKGDVKVSPLNADKTSTTTLGIGSVMTLLHTDPDYCFEKDCLYSFRVNTQSVAYVEFQAVLMDSESTIEVGQGNTMVDQLRDNDNATYVIKSNAGDKSWNWRFNLVPIEGNPDIAVNGDTKPTRYEDYKWKSALQGNEDIMIMGNEINELGLSGQKFFVYMTAKKQTTFLLSISKQPPIAHQHILPNQPVTGEVLSGEIVNYFFKGMPTIPETIEMFAKIKVLTGDSDLYIKSCLSHNTIECLITKEDIQQAKSLSANESIYFRYSSEIYGDESKHLEFNCLPGDVKYNDFIFEGSKLFTSKTCLFAIAVVGKESSTHTTSKYTVELRGAKFHNLLKLNEAQNFRVDQEKSLYLMIDVEKKMFTDESSTQHLNFKFITISGDVDIYISRSNPFPSESVQDKTLRVDNNNTQLRSTVKYGSFKGTPSELSGRYYITLAAKQFIIGSVVCSIGNESLEDSIYTTTTELFFGDPLIESILVKDGAKKLFFFNLDVPSDKSEVEIVVQLTSISGEFSFCVANNFENLRLKGEEGCTWSDINKDGNIVINQDHGSFVRKGRYGVLVTPRVTVGSVMTEGTYSLSLSSQDSGVRLTEGVPFKMSTLRTPKVFKLTTDLEYFEPVIVLSTLDPSAVLECSPNKEDMEESSNKTDGIKSSTGPQATVMFKSEKKNDHIFIDLARDAIYCKVTPSRKTPYEYSLMFILSGGPSYPANFDIVEGSGLSLPLPIRSSYALRHKPVDLSKPLTVNVYSESSVMEVIVELTATRVFTSNDPVTNVIHLSVEDLKELGDNSNHGNLAITIINRDAKRFPDKFSNESFELTERIWVQVTSGVKRLNNVVPIFETQGIKGTFIFYKFVKPRKTNAMVYLTVASGEADLYARKGEDRYPDLNTFDFRANSVSNDQLMIPASPKSSEDAFEEDLETYIVGVYSVLPSSFQIVATKNTSFLFQEVFLDSIITKKVPRDGYLLLSFNNRYNSRFIIGAYGQNGRVKVSYKSHKEDKDDDFWSSVPGDNAPGFVAAAGKATRHVIQPLLGSTGKRQYIIKLQPIEGSDDVVVFIQQEGDSLNLSPDSQFQDSLEKNACQKYSITYDEIVIDESFEVQVKVGKVNVTLEKQDNGESKFLTQAVVEKRREFKFSELIKSSVQKTFEQNFFKSIFATVCSMQGASTFTVRVPKISQTLHRLVPGARFVVSLNQREAHKMFYQTIHSNSTKSLVIRFDLQAHGNSSSKVTSLDKIMDLLEFIYVVDDKEAPRPNDMRAPDKHPDSLGQNKIHAEVIAMKEIADSGSKIGLLKIAVRDGTFLIRAKRDKELEKDFAIYMQVIFDEVYPMSIDGKTLVYLEPSKEAVYQIIKPQNSFLSLQLTSCYGKSKVELYSVDSAENAQKTLVETVILTDGFTDDFLAEDRIQGEFIRMKISSELSMLKIVSLTKDGNSSVTIDSELVTSENEMVISDYFAQHTEGVGYKGLFVDSLFQNSKTYEFAVLNPAPAVGFDDKYLNYNKVLIEKKVIYAWTSSNPSSIPIRRMSNCEYTPELAKQQNSRFDSLKTVELERTKGVFNWSASGDLEEESFKIPKEGGSNRAVVICPQIKYTFEGENMDSSDDDAVVLITPRYCLLKQDIEYSPPVGRFGLLIWAAFVCLAIGLCLVCYKRLKAPGRAGPANHREIEIHSQSQSMQIETIDASRSQGTKSDNELEGAQDGSQDTSEAI